MKKTLHIITFAAVAIATLASCAKEEFTENAIPAGEPIEVSLNGQIGDFTPADATKATAESVVRVTWGSGDKVYVYDGGNASIGTLTVTPDDNNASYAMLSGTIKASAASPSKLTLVYVKGATAAPDIAGGKISVDLSSQNEAEVPFVLYTTVDYDAAALTKTNEYISFTFATSVMTVNCTGLQSGDSGAVAAIDKAEIDGVSTACELTIDGSGVTAVAGTTPGTITRTAGFTQADQRAIFSVALPKTDESAQNRTIEVTKGGRTFSALFPNRAFDVSKSFNSVFALEAVPVPFTITSTGSTTVSINKVECPENISLEYKKGSDDWATYTIDSQIELTDGECLQFRAGEGGNASFSRDKSNYYYVSVFGDGKVSASGNIMSLLDSRFERICLGEYMFINLFFLCDKLTDASNLALPATTLAYYCYGNMFAGCTSLTAAPALPATTLAEWCYSNMFAYSGLTAAPALPATTLAEYCYSAMFAGCEGLSSAPALPATTLAERCYNSMFSDCTNLTNPPSLPATTLAEDCYNSMFDCCEKLTVAPELPATSLAAGCYFKMFSSSGLTSAPDLLATTLVKDCYSQMFSYCSSLNYVKALFTTSPGEDYTEGWLSDVASSGTFVKNHEATWDVSGANGIPLGWTVDYDAD